jgi:hypothetical protein
MRLTPITSATAAAWTARSVAAASNGWIESATVRLIGPRGEVSADAALGTGPVDAVYQAINRIIRVPNRLTEFSVSSITAGIDAMGEVLIRIERKGSHGCRPTDKLIAERADVMAFVASRLGLTLPAK